MWHQVLEGKTIENIMENFALVVMFTALTKFCYVFKGGKVGYIDYKKAAIQQVVRLCVV